jgi:ABC-2 type transport system ATP-binding protein
MRLLQRARPRSHDAPAADRDLALSGRDVRKHYADVEAVRGIDIAVPQGECFGFLGPNGAGKTTMINMLCTLARPTSGQLAVAGFDVVRQAAQVRRNIGLVFQQTTLDGRLTAEENLRFHADLYALDRASLPGRIDAVLDVVQLRDRRHDLVGAFSGGMQRRLEIARGLLHRPRVLFLDEPTIGLDPHARAQVWTHLRQAQAAAGTTLFLTTHYLDEAEQCDRIMIIDAGRAVAEGRPSELKALLGSDRVELRTGDDEAAAQVLRQRFGLDPVVEASGVVVRADNGAQLVPKLCAELGVPVFHVTVTRPSLDDVFLHHTSRPTPDPAQAGAA